MMRCELLSYEETVTIDNKVYAINTDFSVWIEIEQLFLNKNESYETRLAKIFSLAYPKLPENPMKALEKIVWFYSKGADALESSPSDDVSKAPLFDLKMDFEYICASFLKEYGINLLTEEMHWWKFKLLFSCLSEDCKFSKIVGYRSLDISKIKNREMRNFYNKMKKKYRLPDKRTELEKETETAAMLENLFL